MGSLAESAHDPTHEPITFEASRKTALGLTLLLLAFAILDEYRESMAVILWTLNKWRERYGRTT